MKNAISRIAGMLALALLAATQTLRAQEPVFVNRKVNPESVPVVGTQAHTEQMLAEQNGKEAVS